MKSFVLKVLSASLVTCGGVCYKLEHVDTTDGSYLHVHPHTQTGEEALSLLDCLYVQLGSLCTFIPSTEQPNNWNTAEKFAGLFSYKCGFYLWQLSISSQKNTGSSWNYRAITLPAKFSLAQLPVDLSFMWWFFWWELLFALRSSKLISIRNQHYTVCRIRMWILSYGSLIRS